MTKNWWPLWNWAKRNGTQERYYPKRNLPKCRRCGAEPHGTWEGIPYCWDCSLVLSRTYPILKHERGEMILEKDSEKYDE